MKSEERHKLHQNALAIWIAETMTTIKPYQNAILGGLIVVILVVIVAIWWTSESTASGEPGLDAIFHGIRSGKPFGVGKSCRRQSPLSRRASRRTCRRRYSTGARLQSAFCK